MPIRTDILTQPLLRDVLAFLYPRDADARRVARDAELNETLIPFDPTAINTWSAILLEAQKQGLLENVIAIALKDYPTNAPLLYAVEPYQESTVALTVAAPQPLSASFTDLCGGTSESNSMPEFSPTSGTFAAERANHLRSLIRQCQLHLEALEKQRVAFGIHTPHDIVVELENTQSEMTKWAEELARLELSYETNTHYDAAILCHEHDHNLVEIIALRLRNHSFNVWFEPWDRIPGSRIEEQLEQQIELAPVCAIVVGPATPETWLVKAIELALHRQEVSEKYRILPVLLPQCTDSVIARYPSIREWSDFRGDIQDDWALHVLIQSVKGLPIGPPSTKPTSTIVDISQYKQQLSAILSIADEGLIEPEVKIDAQKKIVNQMLLSWA